jgi:hypothetical protein
MLATDWKMQDSYRKASFNFLIMYHFNVLQLYYMQVHILCPIGKQWILIVVNFKSFDELNPDYAVEKFSTVVNTLIFNFKQLFVKSYPGCFKFNIHDFSVKYVHVRKQNFR